MRLTITAIVVAGLALAGCAFVAENARVASVVVQPPAVLHRIGRSVQFKPPAAAEPDPPDFNVRAAKRVVGGAGGANTGAAPEASPWDRFEGELVGSTHEVARVAGADVAVSPHPEDAPAITLSNTSPLGAPRVFLVVYDAGDWLQVLLPLRPNNSVGWIRRSDVEITTSSYRVVIERASHRIHVFDGDELVVDDAVAVGRAATPTPAGQFFTIELLQPANANGAYGPYAFTLSAYSNVFQTFGSGDGAVGLHGTNEQSSIGRDASHGCVRLRNDTVRALATFLPLGTPVFIR